MINLWIYFFIIVGIVAFVFSVLSLSLPPGDQREFSQQMAFILVPIIAGGITTKFTTDAWQVTKEKLEIKRKILSDYEESYKQRSLLVENFVYKLLESYIQYENTDNALELKDYGDSKSGIVSYVRIPDDRNQIPKIKLAVEQKDLSVSVEKASLIQNRFFSSVRLYYDDSTIETKIRELEKLLNRCDRIVLRLFHIETTEKLLHFYENFQSANKETIKKLKEIETQLVALGFREIKV